MVLEELNNFFNIKVNSKLVDAYCNGLLPSVLYYDKIQDSSFSLTALERYLIGYESMIRFNKKITQYYDIYRACRFTSLLQLFYQRIPILKTNVKNYAGKLEKLKTVTKLDDFESVLFEFYVATKYAMSKDVEYVEFVEEKATEKTPDFRVKGSNREIFVECKRLNRINDAAINIRNKVRELHIKAHTWGKSLNNSIMFEVTFHSNPLQLNSDEYVFACRAAAASDSLFFENSDFSIQAKLLPRKDLKDYLLNPSPKQFKDLYDFSDGGDWKGLIPFAEIKPLYFSEELYMQKAVSSWIDEISKEFILKWKISSVEVLRSFKKLNFKRLFEGFDQLEEFGPNTVIHYSFERDRSVGHRQEQLFELMNSISPEKIKNLSWVVFNEIQFGVSYNARFDFQEFAHPVSGPKKFGSAPFVTNVFVNSVSDSVGEFGVGHNLVDIDIEANEREKK